MNSNIGFKIIDSISTIPTNINCKDREGPLLWCNEGQLKTLELTNIAQILGKIDSDLCDQEVACKIRKFDFNRASQSAISKQLKIDTP